MLSSRVSLFWCQRCQRCQGLVERPGIGPGQRWEVGNNHVTPPDVPPRRPKRGATSAPLSSAQLSLGQQDEDLELGLFSPFHGV